MTLPIFKRVITRDGDVLDALIWQHYGRGDVLAAVQAQGTQIKATALNDYRISIPVSDAQRFDLMLATRIGGETIPVRTKGPLFIVYPFDTDRQLQSNTYYERSIWQLKSIEVQ